MSELLTTEEYKAIAAGLDFPNQAFIDGGFRPAKSGKTFDTVNPATGEVLTGIAACGSADVDFAVEKARDAFEDGRWSRLAPGERKQVLIRLAKLIKRNARELAVMESLDSGKTIFDCERVDVPETIHCLIWHAELIDKIYDQISPASDNHIAMIVREPVGVVGLVLPWNFPMLMLAWKIGPALAAGCSVIVKPAEETSLTALRIAELAMEAGVPAGVFNVVPGAGPDVGEPLGRHMDVDMISFTGSTETGRRFLRYASESNLKKSRSKWAARTPPWCSTTPRTSTVSPPTSSTAPSGTWRTARPPRAWSSRKVSGRTFSSGFSPMCANGRSATRSIRPTVSGRSFPRPITTKSVPIWARVRRC